MKLKGKSLDVLAEIRKDPRASFRELMERCGLSSTSVVSYHVDKLEKAGAITRKRGARGIYIGERKRGNNNGHYKFHKSAEEISRIRREAVSKKRKFKRVVETRKQKMQERGEGNLPRMSKAELQERIDRIVERAEDVRGREPLAQRGGRDVVRIERGKMLRSWKCHKVG